MSPAPFSANSAAKKKKTSAKQSVANSKTTPSTKDSIMECIEKSSDANTASSPESFDAGAWNACTQNPPGQLKAKSLRGRNISNEMEEQPSESQKLSQCLEKLTNLDTTVDDAENADLVFGPADSKFRKNITNVYYTLEELAKSRVLHTLSDPAVSLKSEAAAIYIGGVPGTGKTSGIRWCCKRIIGNLNNNNWTNQHVDPVVVEVNAAHLASSGSEALKKQLLEAIWSQCNVVKSKMTDAALLKSLKKPTRKNEKQRFVILVLDEIDQLVAEKGNNLTAKTAAEKLLKELNSWTTDPNMRFVMIGIGNSLNNTRLRRVEQFVKVSSPVFPQCAIVESCITF